MPPRRIPLYARKPRKFSHFQRFPPVQNFYDIASNQPWNPPSQPLPADSSTQHSRPAPPAGPSHGSRIHPSAAFRRNPRTPGRKAQRGLAELGRSQESVESKERHKLLCGKMLQWPRIKIEHGRQRFAGL